MKKQQVNKTLTNFLGENRQSTESPNLYGPYFKLLQTCQNINKTKDRQYKLKMNWVTRAQSVKS